MNRNLLIAIILIASVAALLLGAYWYMSSQTPPIRSADLYAEPSPQAQDPGTSQPVEESVPAQTTAPEVSSPPLSSSNGLKEIEADLNQTIIEEEVFSDL